MHHSRHKFRCTASAWIVVPDAAICTAGGDVGAYNRVYNYLLDRVKAATTLLVQTDDEVKHLARGLMRTE